jgi:DHA2 family multidrug resistance protein
LWFLLPRIKTTPRKFDLTGWLLIAIGLSAFQLMLDRGQHVDWFNSTEIWIETGVAIGAMWMFMVHLFTGREPLFPPGMLADSNLIAGSFFMFMMGLVAYAGMALIPPMLQTLYGYTVIDTGVALASRGFGVLITMGVAGRISGLIDPRLIVGSGFAMVAFSLWMMTGWSLDMDWHPVMLSGFIQGLGLGFIFVPLNVLSFATLAPKYRTDGAGFFNLARSIGSSIGIAIAASMLARNLQGSHEVLAGHITPYNLAIDPSVTETMGSAGDAAMAMVDAMVNREAAMLAYLDDFHMMMMATLIVMPLLIFIKPPRKGKAGPPIILGE